MGQNNGVLLKEVSAFRRYPLIMVRCIAIRFCHMVFEEFEVQQTISIIYCIMIIIKT